MKRSPKMVKKRKMVIVAVIILVAASFFQNREALEKLVPSESGLDQKLLELKREQKRLQRELLVASNQDQLRRLFHQKGQEFWLASRDGEPETKIHGIVEEVAKLAEVQLRVLGNLRRSKVRDGLVFLEFNLAATAPMKALAKFFEELENKQPRFYWQRLSLRPGGAQTPDQVIMNGNIRFFVITDDHTVNFLKGGKK